MFDGGGAPVGSRMRPQNALYGEVVTLGAAAGKNDFGSFGTEDVGNLCPGCFDGQTGGAGGVVQARWVSIAVFEIWLHSR